MVLLSLLATALLATGPALAPAENPPRSLVFDVPDALDGVRVPGDLEALGVPLDLKAVRSSDDVATLKRYFERRFAEAHLYVLPDGAVSNPGWPSVVGFDSKTRISYVVILQDNGDGTSTAIVGKARLNERRDTSKDAAIAPVFPGARDFAQSNLESAHGMSYVARASAEEVRSFYRDTLRHSGFHEAEAGVFVSPRNERLRVKVTDDKGGLSRVLVVREDQPSLDGSPPEE